MFLLDFLKCTNKCIIRPLCKRNWTLVSAGILLGLREYVAAVRSASMPQGTKDSFVCRRFFCSYFTSCQVKEMQVETKTRVALSAVPHTDSDVWNVWLLFSFNWEVMNYCVSANICYLAASHASNNNNNNLNKTHHKTVTQTTKN